MRFAVKRRNRREYSERLPNLSVSTLRHSKHKHNYKRFHSEQIEQPINHPQYALFEIGQLDCPGNKNTPKTNRNSIQQTPTNLSKSSHLLQDPSIQNLQEIYSIGKCYFDLPRHSQQLPSFTQFQSRPPRSVKIDSLPYLPERILHNARAKVQQIYNQQLEAMKAHTKKMNVIKERIGLIHKIQTDKQKLKKLLAAY